MGIIRKATSVTTFGLVDFRSDKERTARYTRQSRDELRKLRGEVRANTIATAPMPTPVATQTWQRGEGGWWLWDSAAGRHTRLRKDDGTESAL